MQCVLTSYALVRHVHVCHLQANSATHLNYNCFHAHLYYLLRYYGSCYFLSFDYSHLWALSNLTTIMVHLFAFVCVHHLQMWYAAMHKQTHQTQE